MVMFSPTAVNSGVSGDTILKMDMFLGYMCCGGCACGPMKDPLCAGEAKQLCFHSTFNTTDMKNEVDGLCGSYETCLCFTSQCQLPPMKGSPKCALFGKEFAPAKDEVSKSDEVLKDYAGMMTDSWFCIYCLCGGMGCSKIKGNDRPFIGAVDKCLCCRGSLDFDAKGYGIEEDGTMCAYSGTELCFWGQCQFPINKKEQHCCACIKKKIPYYPQS